VISRCCWPLRSWLIGLGLAAAVVGGLAGPALEPVTAPTPDTASAATATLWLSAAGTLAWLWASTARTLWQARAPGVRTAPTRGIPALVWRLARRSAGLGLTASMVVGVLPADGRPQGDPPAPPPTTAPPAAPDVPAVRPVDSDPPLFVRVPDPGEVPADARGGSGGADDTAGDGRPRGEPTVRMRRVDPPATTTTSVPPTVTSDEPGPTSSVPAGDGAVGRREPAHPSASTTSPTTDAETWVIAPGEHLWHVAEATVGERGGAPPPAAAVLRYHRILVETNRDRLVDPTNPDLVYPGQVFVLPLFPA
jgi:hypothetical protein